MSTQKNIIGPGHTAQSFDDVGAGLGLISRSINSQRLQSKIQLCKEVSLSDEVKVFLT